MTMEVDLAARIRQLLGSLHEPALAPFLAEWPRVHERRAIVPSHLPVLRWLPEFTHDVVGFGGDLVAALCHAAPSLAWRQTYTANDLDSAFLDNYGWSEIFGGTGPLASERLACGFLILGPSTHYPRHRHEAEEMYLPMSGTAAWLQGDSVWRQRSAGTPIFHASDEPHAMRTGTQPLLALYVWRGANLDQKARLD